MNIQQTTQYSIARKQITIEFQFRVLFLHLRAILYEAQFTEMRHIFNRMNCIAPRGQMEEMAQEAGDKYSSIAIEGLRSLAVTQHVYVFIISPDLENDGGRYRGMLDPKLVSPLIAHLRLTYGAKRVSFTFEYRSTRSEVVHTVPLVWWTYVKYVGVVTEWEPTGGNLQ